MTQDPKHRPRPTHLPPYVEPENKPPSRFTEEPKSDTPGVYTVVAGDTIVTIAKEHKLSWQRLYKLNRDKLDSPNNLVPGQKLKLS